MICVFNHNYSGLINFYGLSHLDLRTGLNGNRHCWGATCQGYSGQM